jgi:hypothetical protein
MYTSAPLRWRMTEAALLSLLTDYCVFDENIIESIRRLVIARGAVHRPLMAWWISLRLSSSAKY